MTASTDLAIGYSDGDVDTNNTANPTLNALIEQRYSRRDTLRSGASAAAVAVFGGGILAACDSANAGEDPSPNLISVGSSGSATSGQVVTLTSNATDNGPIPSAWVQTGGPAVTLIGASSRATVLTRVDFPWPLAPKMPMRWPASTDLLTPCTMVLGSPSTM